LKINFPFSEAPVLKSIIHLNVQLNYFLNTVGLKHAPVF